MELLRFVYKNFCENKRLLIFIIMGNFLTFVLALVVPYLNGFYFNIVIYTPSKEKIIKFGCLIVGLGVITTMLTYCFNIYKTKVQSQLVFKTMNEIIRCVQYSDYSESSKFNPSYLHQKINIDANKIWSFVFDNIISSVFQSLTIIGVIIAIGKINKKIFLLIMFIVPAYILSYYYLKKPLYEQSTRYKEEQSAYYKHINEQFEFIKKIKLWADYKNKENKRRREFGKYLEEFMKYTKLSYFYNSLESITSISNNHPETDILEITTLLVPEEILEQVLIGCEQLLKSLYPFNISKLRIKTIGSDLEMLEKQLFNCGFKKVSQLMDEYGKGNDLIIYDWTV